MSIAQLIKRKLNEENTELLKNKNGKKLKFPSGNKSAVKINPPVKESITETIADDARTPLTMQQQVKSALNPYGVLNDPDATSSMKDYAFHIIQIRKEGEVYDSFDFEEDADFLFEKEAGKSKSTFSDAEKTAARAKIAANPANHMNIVKSLEEASPEEHAAGREWYPHSHRITKMLADHHGPAINAFHKDVLKKTEKPDVMHMAAGLMGLYSPQSDPHNQSLKASVSMQNQKGVGGKGSGFMASETQAKAADKILSGTPWTQVMGKNKIHHYTHLIEHGGNKDDNNPHVAVDTHAMSVVHGVRFKGVDYATHAPKTEKRYKEYLNHYKAATDFYNAKHETDYKPHEVQAITWLRQQRSNKESEIGSSKTGTSKAAKQMSHSVGRWKAHASEIGLKSDEMTKSGYEPETHLPPERENRYKEDPDHMAHLHNIGFFDHKY